MVYEGKYEREKLKIDGPNKSSSSRALVEVFIIVDIPRDPGANLQIMCGSTCITHLNGSHEGVHAGQRGSKDEYLATSNEYES